MSFLAWAFALGGMAIAFPVLFHLIRPTPKGSRKFSSLMFLNQSPPRISRRSRIDHWLLLLLRALVVLLIAAAFMRPYFRTGAEMFVGDLPGNRVAILVDRSASMKRGDLWSQAIERVDEVLEQLEAGDDVALFVFDQRLLPLVGFANDELADLENRKQMIRSQLATVKTTWRATDFGNALTTAADVVTELQEERRSETGLQIVLISDMQSGGDLSGLQTMVWPEDLRVDVRPVRLTKNGNASARVLPDESASSVATGTRVRITNAAASATESFRTLWVDEDGQEDSETESEFYVPPGGSQVIRMPEASEAIGAADRLVLRGDDSDFDNEYFVTPTEVQEITIAYFGRDSSDDPEEALYFLQRAIPDSRNRKVRVEAYSPESVTPWKDGLDPRLVVVTSPVARPVANQIYDFVIRGGTLLVTVTSPEILNSLQQLLPGVAPGNALEDPEDYAMLASIDFNHPVFRPLSGPRFNDFTGLRFWKHQPLLVDDESDQHQVLARFDDDFVAMWQQSVDQGTVIGMASSWKPADSQMALSTKFVPMITSILQMTDRSVEREDSLLVGDRVVLPKSDVAWQVRTPQGERIELEPDWTSSEPMESPGIYEFRNQEQMFRVAVNLHPSESLVDPVDASSLEAFDVRIGVQPTREELAGSLQKLKDIQLEGRQRIWKWLLLAAICLLVFETLLAGRHQNQSRTSEVAA